MSVEIDLWSWSIRIVMTWSVMNLMWWMDDCAVGWVILVSKLWWWLRREHASPEVNATASYRDTSLVVWILLRFFVEWCDSMEVLIQLLLLLYVHSSPHVPSGRFSCDGVWILDDWLTQVEVWLPRVTTLPTNVVHNWYFGRKCHLNTLKFI